VLHPPVDVDFFTPDGAAPERYFLVVSALVPYKRIEVAIAAADRLQVPLKVVGGGPDLARLQALAGRTVEFTGPVNDETLRTLYRRAEALLLPAEEDFGIAPVEALACGTPVVALGRGGVLDVVEDGVHGVLYEVPRTDAGTAPIDAESVALAAAIDKSGRIRWNIGDLRGRAETFSYSRFYDRFSSLLAERAPGRGEGSP
jgi:glycosyltransferase involved in cell wall biosynthesis